MEKITIIGIDSATVSSKTGLVKATYDNGHLVIDEVWQRQNKTAIVEQVRRWAEGVDASLLLAIDSPLGWPENFAKNLTDHVAGKNINMEKLETSRDDFFYRRTDTFIKQYFSYNKRAVRPFSVASDKIAKTAFWSLQTIEEINHKTNRQFGLAWDINFRDGVIEVYPAATIGATKYESIDYKRYKKDRVKREILLDNFKNSESYPLKISDRESNNVVSNDHAFDAFVCCLAAYDFICKPQIYPSKFSDGKIVSLTGKELEVVKKNEGWIWVKEIE